MLVHEDTGDLDDADHAEEEVDSSEAMLGGAVVSKVLQDTARARDNANCHFLQVVLGLDDQAPPRPDDARRRQGPVLRKRQLLGRAGKVGDASEDKTPFHNRSPGGQFSVSMNVTRQCPDRLPATTDGFERRRAG